MGDRKEARVKMVLPIRVWGVDGSGQLFNQLAHTLDISRTGARLGGMRGMLAAGDSLTVQYKQKKAQFKVVWVGRPGSVGERQVGLASLELDKYIWIDIPKEEYRDQFDPVKSPRKRAPATGPEPVPAAPSTAAPIPAAEKPEPAAPAEAPPAPASPAPPSSPAHPVTTVASPAAPPVTAPANSAAVLTQRLKKLTAELLDLQDALKTDEVDPVALQDFRSIVNIIRHYGWVLQQWIEQQKGAEQAFPLAVMLLRERIRLASQLLQSMSADVAQGIGFEADQMQSLQAAARELFSQRRLSPAPTPETAKDKKVPPLPVPAPAVPIKDLEQELQACDKDLGKGLSLIAERMRLWTGADGAAIALRDGDLIVCQGSVGLAPDVGVPLPEDSPLIGDSLRTGLPASCSDTENDPRVDPEICRSIGLRSTAIVPILHEGAACGVLQVFSSTPAVFQPGHIRLLQQVAEVVNEFCLLARS